MGQDVHNLSGCRPWRPDRRGGDYGTHEGDPHLSTLSKPASDAMRRKVLELYADADREVAAAGAVCIASGRCCRFKEYGHTLFLSNLEAEVLLSAAPAYESPVSADFCPFQQGTVWRARD